MRDVEQPFFSEIDSAVAGAATGAAQRCEPRDSLFLAAQVARPGEVAAPARIRNLSGGGLMADCAQSFAAGDRIEIELKGVGLIPGRVAWVGEAGRIGVAFDRRIDPALARRPLQAVQQPQLVKASTVMRRPGLREAVGFVPARKFR